LALILNLETATAVCSVAVSRDGNVLQQLNASGERAHASQLTTLITQGLQQTGTAFTDLDAVAVSNGPGSYTGLRIGLSTAKGICYAADKPLITVGTLEAMAAGWYAQHPNQEVLVCPMIDARRMEVYTAVFSHTLENVMPVQALVLDDCCFAELLENKKVVFFGDGMPKAKTLLSSFQNAVFDDLYTPSAAGVALRAEVLFRQGDFEDLASAGPFYLKEFRTTAQKKGMI
jgi:tRNA threonylcarbamoyladenosine biosynthesis protein TsaB